VEDVSLDAMPDPAPKQNFFDRSDKVSFADKGIPARIFSLGIMKGARQRKSPLF
jgi:hypothetical protein